MGRFRLALAQVLPEKPGDCQRVGDLPRGRSARGGIGERLRLDQRRNRVLELVDPLAQRIAFARDLLASDQLGYDLIDVPRPLPDEDRLQVRHCLLGGRQDRCRFLDFFRPREQLFLLTLDVNDHPSQQEDHEENDDEGNLGEGQLKNPVLAVRFRNRGCVLPDHRGSRKDVQRTSSSARTFAATRRAFASSLNPTVEMARRRSVLVAFC